mmetsp:Transcript_315/g.1451  ORF Transcript_315/g.1451 Transcript_315/m.1451 type:complete len:211 (+) Transcript_315:647-1279(+)
MYNTSNNDAPLTAPARRVWGNTPRRGLATMSSPLLLIPPCLPVVYQSSSSMTFLLRISILGPPRPPPSPDPPLIFSSMPMSASSVTLPPSCPRCAAWRSMFSSACAFSGLTSAMRARRSLALGSISEASAAPRCSCMASARSCAAWASSGFWGMPPSWAPSSARRFCLMASSVGSMSCGVRLGCAPLGVFVGRRRASARLFSRSSAPWST